MGGHPAPADRTDRLYRALHRARESLCVAQTDVPQPAHRAELQAALDLVDRLGVYYCPRQWSRFDVPPLPGESG